MKTQILELKARFYELVGSLSIDEIMSNRPLISAIERISRMLVAASERN